MVAKSFQAFKQLGEPFLEKGKMYVNVQNEKTGTVRKVRWYTEAEYAKMYGEKVDVPASEFKNQKKILGFENGYVTIFKGDTYANLEWFQRSIARYCKWWGWYIVSTDTIPFDLPCGLEPVELKWEMVGEEDGLLKDESVIRVVIDNLLYEPSDSQFKGSLNERLDLTVTITKAIEGESHFGNYVVHEMVDKDGNVYVWKTSSKSWIPNTVKHIRGTVKEHKAYKGVNKTILTRCVEVK